MSWRVLFALTGLAGCDALFLDRSPLEDCPANYMRVKPERSLHRVVAMDGKWATAQADCLDDTPEGITHLAVIDTFTEIDSIYSLTEPGRILWLGYARDFTADDKLFFAVTGEQLPAGASLWAGNEPNNFNNSEAAVVLEDRGLNDTNATDNHHYVCECDGRQTTRTFMVTP